MRSKSSEETNRVEVRKRPPRRELKLRKIREQEVL